MPAIRAVDAMTAADELRDLDRRVALLRGEQLDYHYGQPREYSSSLEHAGPLLAEMAADREIAELYVYQPRDRARRSDNERFAVLARFRGELLDCGDHGTLTEAICRAWLAWQEARDAP